MKTNDDSYHIIKNFDINLKQNYKISGRNYMRTYLKVYLLKTFFPKKVPNYE